HVMNVSQTFSLIPSLQCWRHALSLHDALPICQSGQDQDHAFFIDFCGHHDHSDPSSCFGGTSYGLDRANRTGGVYMLQRLDKILDRKSTRLNSSHVSNSYAVFCSKKKPERRPK